MLRQIRSVCRVAPNMISSLGQNAPNAPLVVIIGATGTGKSKLAIDLAKRFPSEIINADAIQLYQGLPVLTNKLPITEQHGIPHHLLDCIGVKDEPWTVRQYVHECIDVIEAVRQRGKLPIVVGGTGYYVLSLLFKNAILDPEGGNGSEGTGHDKSDVEDQHLSLSILERPTEQLYKKLQEVDPTMAQTWHPNDRRKIQRSLEIWLKSGRRPSEVYAEQKSVSKTGDSAEAKAASSEVRYDPVIVWLEAEDAALKARLDERVDGMIDQGLFEEVAAMHKVEEDCKLAGVELDQMKGIWVAIGYKQLLPWLHAVRVTKDANTDECSIEVDKLRQEGIERMKAATRQYAKNQNRWIRIRLAKALQEAEMLDKMFLLDCTNIQTWSENVVEPSADIVTSFLSGINLPMNSSLSRLAERTFRKIGEQSDVTRQTRYCEVCNKTLMNEQEWQKHLKGQMHKKVLAGIRKRAQRDEYFSKSLQSR